MIERVRCGQDFSNRSDPFRRPDFQQRPTSQHCYLDRSILIVSPDKLHPSGISCNNIPKIRNCS